MEPIVNDDFADVYGILYAVTADGYSHEELVKYTEYVERELLGVDGVRRSQILENIHKQLILFFLLRSWLA